MKELKNSMIMLGIMTVLTGIVYPLAMTGMASMFFPGKAGGSLVTDGPSVTGSRLLGQKFTRPEYFHGRPSAADYDGLSSGGTNLGPASKKLTDMIKARADAIRKENGLPDGAGVPADLVFASGSGLDPHISLAGAMAQAPRVARLRNRDPGAVTALVLKNTEKSFFDLYGEMLVNVLVLNRALDAMEGR